jgi:DNA-binding response OmpR family regulator
MHILVVEDEQRLAARLQRVLADEHHTVDVAYDGTRGYEMAASNRFDMIVLDLMLPGMNGMELCQDLRRTRVQTPILMLTARGAVEDRVAGLRAGADDYLVKPFDFTELLARVEALARRGRTLTETASLHVDDLVLDLPRHEARRGERIIELTAKEFALLEYLMRHPGQVLTRAQILDHVWSYDLDAVSNVVDIYIHYLRDKIDRGNGASLIKTVRGVGYRIGS